MEREQAIKYMRDLLKLMVDKKGSDLFITVDFPPAIKIDGKVTPVSKTKLTAENSKALAYAIMNDRQLKEYEATKECNFAIAPAGIGRFRVNAFVQQTYTGMVLRTIETNVPTLEQLGLPDVMKEIAMTKRGLVIMVGGTGSGKSTSLAAIINHRNENSYGHIITIEDPIEFYHDHIESTINQREVGVDVPSFSEAIRRALRQDPDVILVGELRDLETIEAAISAAETGHVVFGTLHTNSAQGTVNRIIDAFPGNLQDQIRTQLASTLIGVVAQTLLPRIGGGRVAAYEVLNVTSGIANLIRENKTFRINSSMQTGAKFGMQLMDDALFHHWKDENVTVEDVLAKAHRPDDLAKRIVQYRRGEGDDQVPIPEEN